VTRTLRNLRALAHVHPRRLLVAPRLESTEDGGELRVHGLVCGVCADRTRQALVSVPGIEDADVDLASGTARVRLAPGAHVDEREMQTAVDRAVIFRGLRHRVERLAARVRGA
jgi:copper chaperone CopZ